MKGRPLDLSEGDIHVWRVRLAAVASPYPDELSSEEKERAASYQSAVARDAFVGCRAALRRILGALCGQSPQALRLVNTPEGKPDFADRPDGLHFNLSHSGTTGVVAVRRGGPVGVDVEQLREVRETEALARRFFQPEEIRDLESRGFSSRAFLSVWTRKEAVAKALGTGLARQFSRFSVNGDPDAGAPEVRWKQGDLACVELRTLTLSDGVGAVAAWNGPAIRSVVWHADSP